MTFQFRRTVSQKLLNSRSHKKNGSRTWLESHQMTFPARFWYLSTNLAFQTSPNRTRTVNCKTATQNVKVKTSNKAIGQTECSVPPSRNLHILNGRGGGQRSGSFAVFPARFLQDNTVVCFAWCQDMTNMIMALSPHSI